jgi:hypothetical protein
MELVYESDPLEVFTTIGGLPTLALIGTTAAIAIPAYLANSHEPDPEPEISENLAQIVDEAPIVALLEQLNEFYTVMERYPAADEIEMVLAETPILEHAQISLEPDTGEVTIQFSEGSGQVGDLTLSPPTGTNTNWTCGGSLATSMPEGVCPK